MEKIDPQTNKLAYEDELKKDIEQPTNIIAVRIFQYLDAKSRESLLLFLLDQMKPGSVIFLNNNIVTDDFCISEVRKAGLDIKLASGYFIKFFERPDIEIKCYSQAPIIPEVEDPYLDSILADEFIVAMKK